MLFFPVISVLIMSAPRVEAYAMTKNGVLSTPEFTKSGLKITWEREVEKTVRDSVQSRSTSEQPFMVAVSGIPGSGKSTGAEILAHCLGDTCLHMPFDGYHFPMESLKRFPDPEDAVYRRGAPDTFHAEALKRDLERIRCGDECAVALPGFDHARGDPEEEAHSFCRDTHNVVVCEGLYLLHDQDGWEEVKDLFDLTIYVDADLDVCIQRLKTRNKCIPGYSPEEIELRVDAVDRVNAMIVEQSKRRADIVVRSAAFA